MVHPSNPIVGDWLVKSRQRDLLQQADHERLLAVARAARPRRRPLQSAARLLGSALVHIGEWLQSARPTKRPELPRMEAPASATTRPS